MKWTKKKVTYNVLQLVFYGLAPLILVFSLYGSMGDSSAEVGFKIAAPGIVLIAIAFLCFKKLYLNKKLSDAHNQLNQLKADLKVKTDAAEVTNIENAIKNLGTVEVLFNSVIPILLFALLILCCKVMEAQLVKLSGTCGFMLVSYIVGTVFAVLDAREVNGKHKETGDERE